MMITKMCLGRRTFLRGVGAAIALPLLDSMVPALSAAPRAVPRLGFFYVPNGMFLPNFHPAGQGGASYVFSPTLKPLEGSRKDIVVVSGLGNHHLSNSTEAGGPHTRGHAGWLTGIRPKHTEGGDVSVGKSIDQYAADKLGADTSLRSLETTTESVGSCDASYNCVYINSTSWRDARTPLPHESDPRAVFERLFGAGGSAKERRTRLKENSSILDSVIESLASLEKRLGIGDRRAVGDYLDAVREVELRIQKAEASDSVTTLPTLSRPLGIPESFDEHVGLLGDLVVLAYQSDITRVSCMQFGRELTGRTYPEIGVPESHHLVSHHQFLPHNIEQYTKINTHHTALFARIVDRMRETADGDGTLLDHVILMYGSAIGDGDQHTPLNLPVVLAGGGCGELKGGRHLKYSEDTPFMNLGLTLLDKVGVHVDEIADSTGRLGDL